MEQSDNRRSINWSLVGIGAAVLVAVLIVVLRGPSVFKETGGPPEASSAQTQTAIPSASHEEDHSHKVDEALEKQVLLYYEIANTENRAEREERLPIVATDHYLGSYRKELSSDTPTHTTVDTDRSHVEVEISETSENVSYVTSTVYFTKVIVETGEEFPITIENDTTTWIKGADGIWKIHGKTIVTQPNN